MKYLLLLSLVSIGLFAFSPGQFTPAFVVNHDKATHALTFFVLMFLAHRSFGTAPMCLVVLGVALLGVAIELIQFLFTSRGFSLVDLLYDSVGIVAYLVVHFVMDFLRRQKRMG